MPRNKTGYRWIIETVSHDSTEEEYLASGYDLIEFDARKANDIPAIYPYPPTKEMYDSGKNYYKRTFSGAMRSEIVPTKNM